VSELAFRSFKFVLLFVTLGPLVGGLIFGFIVGVYSGEWWLMLAAPFYSYAVGALPAALTGLGTSIVGLFARNVRATIGAGTLMGATISPLVFVLGAGSQDIPLLLTMGVVGAVSALPCLWIAYHLDWLERST
jgi:hypothetical protein